MMNEMCLDFVLDLSEELLEKLFKVLFGSKANSLRE